MWYSLVPPALIVLSLAGIIIFLAKKSSQVAEIEIGKEKFSEKEKENFNLFVQRESTNEKEFPGKKEKIKIGILFIAEKTLKKMKIFFLKLENLFSGWGESIRKKRNLEKKNVLDKKDIKLEKNSSNFYLKEEDDLGKNQLLKKEIIMPQGRAGGEEKKDIFENALIERIAANPKDLEAYEKLGDYYMEVKNWDHAKECFKQVLKMGSGNQSVKTKMRKLEKLLEKKDLPE